MKNESSDQIDDFKNKGRKSKYISIFISSNVQETIVRVTMTNCDKCIAILKPIKFSFFFLLVILCFKSNN